MIGTIFQLSAAFLFGWQIAIRDKEAIKGSTSARARVFVGGKEIATTSTEDAYYNTNMYRIGFIYLIVGYLIPLTKIEIGENLDSFSKIFLVIFVGIVFVIIGDNISKFIASYQVKKF